MNDDELARLRAVAEGRAGNAATFILVRDASLEFDAVTALRLLDEVARLREMNAALRDILLPAVKDARPSEERDDTPTLLVAKHAASLLRSGKLERVALRDEVDRLRGLVDPRLAVAWDDEDA